MLRCNLLYLLVFEYLRIKKSGTYDCGIVEFKFIYLPQHPYNFSRIRSSRAAVMFIQSPFSTYLCQVRNKFQPIPHLKSIISVSEQILTVRLHCLRLILWQFISIYGINIAFVCAYGKAFYQNDRIFVAHSRIFLIYKYTFAAFVTDTISNYKLQ